MKMFFLDKVDQVKIMPLSGQWQCINDINETSCLFKSKSFHGHLIDDISVVEEFLDPNKHFLPINNEARFSQVQWSACVLATMHFLCSDTTFSQQLSSFPRLSNYFLRFERALWMGFNTEQTVMRRRCLEFVRLSLCNFSHLSATCL